ncbi:MAG: phosphoribosyltransferase [Desulfobacterales bacterium]
MKAKNRFRNRTDAGVKLAEKLAAYKGQKNLLVLALPRGGVPVGYEVANFLDAPFDIFLVRKLGVPGQEELAMGAIASGGIRILNEDIIRMAQIPVQDIEAETRKEEQELQRREREYRGDRPMPELEGRRIILVDDGLATGASMKAAVAALRDRNVAEIIVAVPTASPDTCSEFEAMVDQVICARTPEPFGGVGAWYEDFSQTTDDEVRKYMQLAEENLPTPS